MDFININKVLPNGQNMGGTIQKIRYAFHDDVLTWPTKPDAAATLDANGVLTGEIIMKPGKCFFDLYLTDDTGEFTIEPVGEKDGKSFVEHVSLFHPAMRKTILGFINAADNASLVIAVTDNNDTQYILGDESRPATYEGAPDGFGTGKETAGRNGVSMEFTYKTAKVLTYEGSIPLTPAA